MRQIYSKKILDHYRNPKNFGRLSGAVHTAELLNPLCGDEIAIDLKIKDGKIADIKYEARGCALMIAASSLASESVKAQNVSEIKKIDLAALEKILEISVPASRQECVLLPIKTMKKSLKAGS